MTSNTTGRFKTRLCQGLAMAAAATSLAGCGGSGADQPFVPPSPEINISAEPAFLNRGCTDGRVSPQLFCPHVRDG